MNANNGFKKHSTGPSVLPSPSLLKHSFGSPHHLMMYTSAPVKNGAITCGDAGKGTPFSGGSFEDGKVAFKGELKTPVGNMAYTITETLIDGKIEAVAKTKMGELLIRST